MAKRPAHRPADPAKQDAILAAARMEFMDRGFEAASIERIAAAADVSKVTIYNQFQSKENLFSQVVVRECARMEVGTDTLPLTGSDLRTQMLRMAEAMGAFLSSPEIIRFDRRMSAESEAHPHVAALFMAAGPNRLRARLAQIIAAGMEAGHLDRADPMEAAAHFAGMVMGFHEKIWRFAPADAARAPDPAATRRAVDRFLTAYRP